MAPEKCHCGDIIQKSPKISKYLGYFCKKIFHLDLLDWSQSGHTVANSSAILFYVTIGFATSICSVKALIELGFAKTSTFTLFIQHQKF